MHTFESLAFYRGMSKRHSTDGPSVLSVRKNRKPKDSAQKFHETADDWFLETFGVRYRSQALFVTSRPLAALGHAASPNHVMRVVPLTTYRYCWSPSVMDLLFKAKELADADGEVVRRFLDEAAFQEHGLEQAHDTGHEVMLFCDQYIAIPSPEALATTKDNYKSSILLP